jgi:hypothetical protein
MLVENTSQPTKLLPIVILSIKARSHTHNKVVEFASYENPVAVKFRIGKKGFKVSDGRHTMDCKFSKNSLFLYKLSNHNKSLTQLKGNYLILNQYSLHSYLDHHNNLKLHLNVYSFNSLNEQEAKGIKFPKKGTLEIVKEPELKPFLEELRNNHLQEALGKQVEEMPELEEILAGRKSKRPNFTTKVKIKSRREDKEDIIDFDKLNEIEKVITEDIDYLLKSQYNFLHFFITQTYTLPDNKAVVIWLKEELKDEAPSLLINDRVEEEQLKERKGRKRNQAEASRQQGKKLKEAGIKYRPLDITKEQYKLNPKSEQDLFK